MDNTTQFIDTLSTLNNELAALHKHLAKLDDKLTRVFQTLAKGDVKDRETRLAKLCDAKRISDEVQNFIAYAVSSRIPKLCGSLETLHTILDEKENEVWVVLASGESLTAPQTVDHLTDAITDYLLAHKDDTPQPRSAFVDNPDSFVANFVATYLNHKITDRMSDMVISLVTDWMSFRLPE